MLNELTVTLLRLGFLILLWFVVLSIVAVLRRDIFGTQVVKRPTMPQMSRRGAAVPPAETGAPRVLVVTKGPLKGTTIALSQAPILIGRAPECTLVLDDDFASNRHARLSPTAGGWVLEDLGSTNGTFLGRMKVESTTPIEPGAPVRIGRTVLELRR